MLIQKPQTRTLDKTAQQRETAQRIRSSCTALWLTSTNLRDAITKQLEENDHELTKEEAQAGLGDDAASLEKYQEALRTFISAIENL